MYCRATCESRLNWAASTRASVALRVERAFETPKMVLPFSVHVSPRL
jgi:hypothetical protein